MLIQAIIFIVGLLILSKSSDKLIDASVSLGKHLRLSNVFIGLTVIAFGTSLPEFLVSYMALSKGAAGLSVGNIVGSNIANVALILGGVGLFFSLSFKNKEEAEGIKKKSFLMIVFYIILVLFSLDSSLSRTDGLVLLLLFILFLWISFKEGTIGHEEALEKKYGLVVSVFLTILSLAGLVLGAKLMTDSAVTIATILGINDYVIGATIVAVGTSLPELAASFSAVKQGETAMSLANIIGSNIFNILMVLGFSSVIFTIPIDLRIVRIDYLIMMFTALILIVFVFNKKDKAPKWIIYVSLLTYVGYILRLIVLALG
ncbi:MAG: calcium/sodium antiporter [Candidatus Margulisbacteria bacterium]|nr:calcium/sodium antiporter [Candidatus Margulisiibacteriota bacterium]